MLGKTLKNSFILSNINVSCCNLTSCPIHCRADRLYEERLVKYRPEKGTVRWIENWLKCQAERIAVSGTECSWGPVSRGEPQGWCQVLHCLTSSLITSTLEQRVPSASLQVTQNLRKQLMHQRAVQASGGTLTGWRNGLVGISRLAAKGREKSGCWEVITPCPCWGWGISGWETALQKRTWEFWWIPVWPWGSNVILYKGNLYRPCGLHSEKQRQQVEGGDLSPLPRPGES